MRENDNIALTRQYDKPTHTIIHASDTQLLGPKGSWHGYPLDADEKLEELAEAMRHTQLVPDAIIFTGDLADDGDAEAYKKLRNSFEPVADVLGAELIWVMGNHDRRETFRSELLYQEPSMAPVDQVHNINGLRVISLDSTVPGHHYGLISDQQLEWIEDVLTVASPHGTILALHHPPIPSVLPLAQIVELQDQKSLAAVIRGTDIRSIIAGHIHYSSFGSFAGIPVSVASSSCYTQKLDVTYGETHPRNGAQAFNVINVYEDSIVHSVVPLGTSVDVGETVPREEVRKTLLDAGLI